MCITTKIEAHMYKWLSRLLENKDFQMKESSSCIDFKALCTLRPKKYVNLRKPVAKAVVIKSNGGKLDKDVLKYMQRNHAASDLALNQKHIGKRLSLPMILSAKENVTVAFTSLVSQQQINAINRKNCYAVSDLALNTKKLIKGHHYL